MSFYFELLSVKVLMVACWKYSLLSRLRNTQFPKVYFVDATKVGKVLLVPMLRNVGVMVNELKFEMRQIKDQRGELLRVRIFRHDLFELRRQILSSDEFMELDGDDWDSDGVRAFIERGVIDGQIMEPTSVGRFAYLVGVVRHHASKGVEPVLILESRPWQSALERYGRTQGVHVVFIPRWKLFSRGCLSALRYKFPCAYSVMRAFKDYGWPPLSLAQDAKHRVSIFVEGRGEVRLRNDGYHTDFYWLLNSSLAPESVCYSTFSPGEAQSLTDFGIKVAAVHPAALLSRRDVVAKRARGSSRFRPEREVINELVNAHRAIRTYWGSVFESNNTKVYLTWYHYDRTHIAIGDAAHDVGGVSVCLPIAFDGIKDVDLTSKFDICFCYSAFAAGIYRQSSSTTKHYVITGYPRDYAPPLLRAEALQLRQRLRAAGARKIVFVIDENSVDDDRWHTGHELQRDNYRLILEKVIATPWLGVVFKPKWAISLRSRLGPAVDSLLRCAENTGRCFVYESSGRSVTSAPPVLAGLAADVCIHSHLRAGTAGLECALAGLPTLLIDREGVPDSKLQQLPRGKVVFCDWPETINALVEHFERPGGIPGFGDWSSVIGELDPFRDGLAAKRIGDYLSWLVEGFERGLDRDTVMEQANDRYADLWGDDKVIRGNADASQLDRVARLVPSNSVTP